MMLPTPLMAQTAQVATAAFDPVSTRKQIISDEGRGKAGKEGYIYNDSRGIPTVGIGFNMQRADARQKMESVGANYERIMSGKDRLSNEQMDTLFEETYKEAVQTARNYAASQSTRKDEKTGQRVSTGIAPVPFDSQPDEAQSILVNMGFNLGPDKLGGFHKLKAALDQQDYKTAANEMKDSKWYGQVKDRSKRLVKRMHKVTPRAAAPVEQAKKPEKPPVQPKQEAPKLPIPQGKSEYQKGVDRVAERSKIFEDD